jgi:hypothetical protein
MQLLDEALHHSGVLADREPVTRWSGGQPETRIVDRDASESVP